MSAIADTSKLVPYTRRCVDTTGTCGISTNLLEDIGVRSV